MSVIRATRVIRAAMAVTLSALAASCGYEELCYDHAHITGCRVAFDWSAAPEASPASMAVYLLPQGGGTAQRHTLTGCEGGTLRVSVGSYHVIAHNSDTHVLLCNNTSSKEDFVITTGETEVISSLSSLSSLGVDSRGVPRAEGSEHERVALPPDPLWTAVASAFSPAVGDEASHCITLSLRPAVETYNIVIRGADNLEHVLGLSATISGMAGGHMPWSGAPTAERVTIPFDLSVSTDRSRTGGTITGSVNSFGHCPDGGDTRHSLMVYALMDDGTKWYYSFDVSAHIHGAGGDDDGGNSIVLDGLPLPAPIDNGSGGLRPSIGAWQTEEIELDM